jgi:hypothetical protein
MREILSGDWMERSKKILIFAMTFAVVTVPIVGQNSSVAGGASPAQQAPSSTLAETISFMNRSVSPEGGYVTSVNNCELYFTTNKDFRLAIPTGQHVISTDKFGVQHYGFNWMVFDVAPAVSRFELARINRNSIKSKPVPSEAFIKEHNVDENLDELKNPDLVLVTFEAADAAEAIEVGHFKDAAEGSTSPVFDRKLATGVVVFESKDRAERFVTAFVHAVQLCGGKSDLFPPTPSNP